MSIVYIKDKAGGVMATQRHRRRTRPLSTASTGPAGFGRLPSGGLSIPRRSKFGLGANLNHSIGWQPEKAGSRQGIVRQKPKQLFSPQPH